MKRICAWCKAPMGEKEPLEDTSETHGICPDCAKRLEAEGKVDNNNCIKQGVILAHAQRDALEGARAYMAKNKEAAATFFRQADNNLDTVTILPRENRKILKESLKRLSQGIGTFEDLDNFNDLGAIAFAVVIDCAKVGEHNPATSGEVNPDLAHSVDEERDAIVNYHARAATAAESGDRATSELYKHVAGEEHHHLEEFQKRLIEKKEA